MFDTHRVIKTLCIFLLLCFWIKVCSLLYINKNKKLIEMFYSGKVDYVAVDTMAPKGCPWHGDRHGTGEHSHGCTDCSNGKVRKLNIATGKYECKDCASNQIVKDGDCETCPSRKKPNATQTSCTPCERGTAGRDGYCPPCTQNYTYASSTGQDVCTPSTRNRNETPDVCVVMTTENGGYTGETPQRYDAYTNSGPWEGCCVDDDCGNDADGYKLYCKSFTNLNKRCLNDRGMKGWCDGEINYKYDIYWDNTNKTNRCFTIDCNDRSVTDCKATKYRDINRSPAQRCKVTKPRVGADRCDNVR